MDETKADFVYVLEGVHGIDSHIIGVFRNKKNAAHKKEELYDDYEQFYICKYAIQ